jgi:stalled ribosome rescue protein Dom34
MKNVGLWIDHEKAFVIVMGSDTTKRLNALAEQSTSPVGSFDISPDNRVDRRRNGHLKTWYKEVMQELVDAENILVLGPGLAKSELVREMKLNKQLCDKIAAVKSAGTMTEKQMSAKVRDFFQPGSESSVPLYRRAPGS